MADTAVKIPFQEASAPSTPASTKVVIYAKSDGLMYSKDDAGAETLMSSGAAAGGVATDPIWDAAGDLAVGTGANTAAKLSIGATNGMSLMRVSGAAAWSLPPGTELAYVEFTSPVSVTATTEATANSIVSAGAVSFDGSTRVCIEAFVPYIDPQNTANATTTAYLYDGSSIGLWAQIRQPTTAELYVSLYVRQFLTPSNASHTYSLRATTSSGSAAWNAGAGGSGNIIPGYIRITKA